MTYHRGHGDKNVEVTEKTKDSERERKRVKESEREKKRNNAEETEGRRGNGEGVEGKGPRPYRMRVRDLEREALA